MDEKSSPNFVKTFISAVLFLATAMSLAIPMQTVRAATITVCASGCDYTTIQAAITAAVAGDTINVGAGTYGGQIIIDKSVTLLGDPGDASAGPGINAPIIDGGSAIGSAFFIANGVSNVTIQGFEMRNFINGSGFGEGNGVSAWEASTSNITIQDNYFHNLGYNGVLVGNDGALGDHTNWTIKGNILETFAAYGFELTNASNSTIEGNVIHTDAVNDPVTAIMVDARRNETGLTIKNNQIDGPITTGFTAVFIFAASLETPKANLNNVLVDGNTISTSGTKPHIYVYNYPGTGTVTDVQVHKNSLVSLKTNTPAQVDATLDWWGDLDPSDNVIGNVNYSPWCTDASCTTFAPPFATLTTITADTPDPSVTGQTVNVSASVAGLPSGAPTPTGIVTVSGGAADCTINLVGGAGSCDITFNVNGPQSITATYNPDTTGFSTSSDTESHTVRMPIFADVPSDYWAWSFIERLYNAGITGGCGTNPLIYCPEADVTRAQLAVFLLRGEHGAAYVPPAVGTGTGFTDVPADYWAAVWIKQLAFEGITSGCGPSLYCPETSVTRDQVAVFLLRAEHGASYTPPPATGIFTDVPTSYWAAAWIEQLATEGITTGCGAGIYCPTAPVTRAQMAVFLVRTFNLP